MFLSTHAFNGVRILPGLSDNRHRIVVCVILSMSWILIDLNFGSNSISSDSITNYVVLFLVMWSLEYSVKCTSLTNPMSLSASLLSLLVLFMSNTCIPGDSHSNMWHIVHIWLNFIRRVTPPNGIHLKFSPVININKLRSLVKKTWSYRRWRHYDVKTKILKIFLNFVSFREPFWGTFLMFWRANQVSSERTFIYLLHKKTELRYHLWFRFYERFM